MNRRLLVGIVTASLPLACSSDIDPPVSPPRAVAVRMEVLEDSIALAQLDSVPVTVTLWDEGGQPIEGRTIHFTASDHSLISVGYPGVVISLGPVGSCDIEVTYESFIDSVHVTVHPVPAKVVLLPNNFALAESDSIQLTARVVDRIGEPYGGDVILFSSGDESLVSVDPSGMARSHTSVGATYVTATSSSGLTATVEAVVARHPVGVVEHGLGASGAWAIDATREGVVVVGASPARRMVLPTLEFTSSLAAGRMALRISEDGTKSYHGYGSGINIVDWIDSTVTPGPTFYSTVYSVCSAADEGILFVGINNPYQDIWQRNLFSVILGSLTVRDSAIIGMTPLNCATHPSDSLVAFSATLSNEVVFVNAHTGSTRRVLSVPVTNATGLQGIAFSPDGTELYVVNENEQYLLIWAVEESEARAQVPLGGYGFDVALSTDAKQLYVTLPSTGIIQVIDVASRTLVNSLAVGGEPRRIAFGLWGEYAIVTNSAYGGHVVIIH